MPIRMTLLGDVALLQLMLPCWRNCAAVSLGSVVSDAQVRPNMAFISAAYNQEVELSISPAPCLPSCLHASYQNNNFLIDNPVLYIHVYDDFKLIGTKSCVVTCGPVYWRLSTEISGLAWFEGSGKEERV